MKYADSQNLLTDAPNAYLGKHNTQPKLVDFPEKKGNIYLCALAVYLVWLNTLNFSTCKFSAERYVISSSLIRWRGVKVSPS